MNGFFSKYYTAVVFEYEAGSVTEKTVDKLLSGDFLVIYDFKYASSLRNVSA